MPKLHCFSVFRNESTRIDRFDELSHTTIAALRSFSRRLGAPHLFDEVILPTIQDGGKYSTNPFHQSQRTEKSTGHRRKNAV